MLDLRILSNALETKDSNLHSLKVAYLGPPGTFTEQAAINCYPLATIKPYSSIPDTALAVLNNEVDVAVCPIENSLQGAVTDTLDALLHQEGLHIRGEFALQIEHTLMAKPGTTIKEIQTIYSHPQALAQCRQYLSTLGPVELAAALSTAGAVQQVLSSDAPSGAIAPIRAAELYGAEVLKQGIQDDNNNYTRFVTLAKTDSPQSGTDLTSIAISFSEDRAGQLSFVLNEFADRGINLTKIESRPTRLGLGKYYFLMDFEGHRENEEIARLLTTISEQASLMKIFGSYPRMA
ncbi:MAG: prephenate dehydratase [Chloroflexi bacterium]|nr:prephenate dehydratase [Chloroflexota bacterium]